MIAKMPPATIAVICFSLADTPSTCHTAGGINRPPRWPKKVCILSDSHDRRDLLKLAVEQALSHGIEAILHCGDVIGSNTLRPVKNLGIPLHVIHGNNLGDPQAMYNLANETGSCVRYHGGEAVLQLAGRKVFLVHYQHHGHAFACTGEWDLVCCGHNHVASIAQVVNVKGGQTWLVNPGAVGGPGAKPTWVLGDLQSMRFEVIPVGAA